jgi:hypothetical protein
MEQAGPALEELKLAIAEEGDLSEGLTREVLGAAVLERNGSHGVGEGGFLTRPP